MGATGLVGRMLLSVLQERSFPVHRLSALAGSRSAGSRLSFAGQELTVELLSEFDFTGVDVAFFSAGGDVSAEHAPRAAEAGAVVIDNTSHFRYEDDVPLVVPEVNPRAVSDFTQRRIIANPNCSTIQMLVALKPIYDAAGLVRINVCTYQAVSGAGRRALDELREHSRALLAGTGPAELDSRTCPKPVAFNALPHIDSFQDNGYTREEMKMVWETQKILADESIRVNPTAVRVPVEYGHSEVLHVETGSALSAAEATELLRQAPGVVVLDEQRDGGYPTALTEAAGRDEVFVGRIRSDISHPNGLCLWVVADNTRKGAALNSIQIAELLIEEDLL